MDANDSNLHSTDGDMEIECGNTSYSSRGSSMRERLIERDGRTCVVTGRCYPQFNIQAKHIIPLSIEANENNKRAFWSAAELIAPLGLLQMARRYLYGGDGQFDDLGSDFVLSIDLHEKVFAEFFFSLEPLDTAQKLGQAADGFPSFVPDSTHLFDAAAHFLQPQFCTAFFHGGNEVLEASEGRSHSFWYRTTDPKDQPLPHPALLMLAEYGHNEQGRIGRHRVTRSKR